MCLQIHAGSKFDSTSATITWRRPAVEIRKFDENREQRTENSITEATLIPCGSLGWAGQYVLFHRNNKQICVIIREVLLTNCSFPFQLCMCVFTFYCAPKHCTDTYNALLVCSTCCRGTVRVDPNYWKQTLQVGFFQQSYSPYGKIIFFLFPSYFLSFDILSL